MSAHRGETAVMTIEALIIWSVIGAVAGWLAGQIVKGYGFGLTGDIVVGFCRALDSCVPIEGHRDGWIGASLGG